MADKNPTNRWLSHIVHLNTHNPSNPSSYADADLPKDIPHIHSGMLPDEVLAWLSAHKRYVFMAVAVVFIIIAGWAFFGSRNSVIIYGDVSYRTSKKPSDLASDINKQLSFYQVKFKYPDSSIKSYKLSEMGITLDSKQTYDQLASKRYSLWHMFIWWKPIKGDLVYKTDSTKLGKFIADNVTHTYTAPQDATIGIVDGNVVVGESKDGQRVFLDKSTSKILASATKLNQGPLVLQKRVVKPSLTSKDFEQYKSQINQIITQKITLKIENQAITPAPNEIASWLDLGTDSKAKKVNIAVNSGKVQQYIDRISSRYTRSVKSQVIITKSDGQSLVLVAGQNGVAVTNKADVAKNVATNLLNNKGIDATLVTKSTPFQTVNGAGAGKWIEVDVSSKRLYAFEDQTLVNSFPVSAGAPATPTVLGRYTIYAKYAVQDMRGNNVDGSSYFQPNVRWISYFYGGYAIHGNYWRPESWFGNVNSSHGCVGLQDYQAEWVYAWAPIGTPVITHS